MVLRGQRPLVLLRGRAGRGALRARRANLQERLSPDPEPPLRHPELRPVAETFAASRSTSGQGACHSRCRRSDQACSGCDPRKARHVGNGLARHSIADVVLLTVLDQTTTLVVLCAAAARRAEPFDHAAVAPSSS
jgi:hypothetical protein